MPNTGDKLQGSNMLGLVSFIDEMDSSNDSVGIDVPESLLCRQGGAHPCRTIRALR